MTGFAEVSQSLPHGNDSFLPQLFHHGGGDERMAGRLQMRAIAGVELRKIRGAQNLFHGQKINAAPEQRLNQVVHAAVVQKMAAVAVVVLARGGQQQNRHAARAGQRDALGGVFTDAPLPFKARGRIFTG
jgi:hypothetical protein